MLLVVLVQVLYECTVRVLSGLRVRDTYRTEVLANTAVSQSVRRMAPYCTVRNVRLMKPLPKNLHTLFFKPAAADKAPALAQPGWPARASRSGQAAGLREHGQARLIPVVTGQVDHEGCDGLCRWAHRTACHIRWSYPATLTLTIA